MRVLSLAFTKLLGIKPSTVPGYLLQLDYTHNILNHMNTVHASAIFGLAETCCGFFLNQHFKEIADQTIPILRSSDIKYTKPGTSNLFAKAEFIHQNYEQINLEIHQNKSTTIDLRVKIYNEEFQLITRADFNWYIKLKE